MTNTSAAFFDVDETVVNIKSMFSFLEFYLEYGNEEPLAKTGTFLELMHYFREIGETYPRTYVNRQYYRLFIDVPLSHFNAVVEKWFEHIYDNGLVFHTPVLTHLRSHQENNDLVVFVSGSCNEILAPIARHLGVTHLLGVTLQVKNEIITGEIVPPQTIGKGKAEAIKMFIRQHDLSAEDCYAYGDHESDIPMLECVANAFAVGSHPQLLRWQRDNNKSHIVLEN